MLGHICLFVGHCVLERHRARPVCGLLCSCAMSATPSFQGNGGGSEEKHVKGRVAERAGSNPFLLCFLPLITHKQLFAGVESNINPYRNLLTIFAVGKKINYFHREDVNEALLHTQRSV